MLQNDRQVYDKVLEISRSWHSRKPGWFLFLSLNCHAVTATSVFCCVQVLIIMLQQALVQKTGPAKSLVSFQLLLVGKLCD